MLTLLLILTSLSPATAIEQTLPPQDPAPAAVAPPLIQPNDPGGPLTWDQLPEPLRNRIDSVVGKPVPQAVLIVDPPASVDASVRRVDHGTVVSEQAVRPASFVSIVTPARNARKYGSASALLWRGVSEAGDWWCWRNDEHFPGWRWPSDIYCYRDQDGDGDFDLVMENSGANGGFVFSSRFQFHDIGHDERVRDVVTYQPAASPLDLGRYVEKIVLRYDGPASGRVQPDGRVTNGEILFDLLTGFGEATAPAPRQGNALIRVIPGPPDDGLTEIGRLVVKIDGEGRGRLADARGITLEVDRVDADGSAQIRLLSGVTAGETLLFPPPSRETFLEMIEEMRVQNAGPPVTP